MKHTIVKVITLLSALILVFSSCGTKETSQNKREYKEGNILPLEESVTLKYWSGNSMPGSVKDYGDMAMYREMEKETGIKVDFIHPVQNQGTEQFNIMIASRDYPDIIEGMNQYQGGFQKAEEDGIIVELTELQSKYAPNLMKLYKKYPLVSNLSQSDEGKYYSVPMIRGGSILRTYMGPIMRKDWLDDLGLEVPETIDEWRNVLTAFKNEKGATAPLSGELRNIKREPLAGAFGIKTSFFVDDGKVVYGPYDSRYREFVRTMMQWYAEGLIDPEVAMINSKIFDSKLMDGETGAYIAGIGGGLGKYLGLMEEKDPKFDLTAVPYPVLKKGDQAKIMQRDPIVQPHLGASVVASSNYQVEAVAFLDYAFSKNGHMLSNFGVEGESYVIEGEYPKYTALITKNQDGLGMSTVGHKYSRSFSAGPFVQDTKYGEQFYSHQRQREASELWASQFDAGPKKTTALLGALKEEDISMVASKETEITTYVNEQLLSWIMNQTSANFDDEFDKYISELKRLGIEDVIKARQDALDRYLTRFPDALNDSNLDVSEFYWSELE